MKVRITSPKGKLRGEFTVREVTDKGLTFWEPLNAVEVGDLIEVVGQAVWPVSNGELLGLERGIGQMPLPMEGES